MRRLLVLLAATTAMTITPSQAAEITLEHEAPIPCAALCPYWQPSQLEGSTPCASSLPLGSYDETRFRFTNEHKSRFVDVEMRSDIDYDLFVCTDSEPSAELQYGCICLPEDCETILYVPVGCTERLTFHERDVLEASGGKTTRFVLRSFNWADTGVARVTVSGSVAITDDSYCALPAGACA